MQTMDAALVELVRKGLISREGATRRARDPEELQRLAGSGGLGTAAGGAAAGGRRGRYSAIRR